MLSEYMAYVWLAVVVLSVFVEGMTMGLVSIWFVPAGLTAMILALCGVPLWIQTTVFFARLHLPDLSFADSVQKIFKAKAGAYECRSDSRARRDCDGVDR